MNANDINMFHFGLLTGITEAMGGLTDHFRVGFSYIVAINQVSIGPTDQYGLFFER
jgi:hypothetical protein